MYIWKAARKSNDSCTKTVDSKSLHEARTVDNGNFFGLRTRSLGRPQHFDMEMLLERTQ